MRTRRLLQMVLFRLTVSVLKAPAEFPPPALHLERQRAGQGGACVSGNTGSPGREYDAAMHSVVGVTPKKKVIQLLITALVI